MQKNKFISVSLSFSLLMACSSGTKHEGDPGSQVRAPASTPPSQKFNHHKQLGNINWRELFYELNYVNLSKQAVTPADHSSLLHNSVYYAANGVNDTYWKLIGLYPTSDAVFRGREDMLGWKDSLAVQMNPLQKKNSQLALARQMGAEALIQTLMTSAKDPAQKLKGTTNYFKTPAGQAVLETLSDYALVIVPGFGSHTIKYYTWPEILRQINHHYGREPQRVVKSKSKEASGAELVAFHNKNPNIKFDIIHPLGYELGDSMGRDSDSANELAKRLTEIKQIPAYRNKKFIILGYSKGAPIATKMVAQNPVVARDVAAILTMAGVVQGALPANTLMRDLYKATNTSTLQDLQNNFTRQLEETKAKYTSVADGFMNQYLSPDIQQQLTNRFKEFYSTGFNLEGATSGASLQSEEDRKKLLEGISDMSNFQSLRWNLANMNNEKFKQPITFFNLSMLTNVKDFVLPNADRLPTGLTPPTLVPQITNNLSIDNQRYSRDNTFLYLTSIAGFEEAPAGLFDTQVAWLDTKSIFLDSRPLNHSLSADQLSLLQKTMAAEDGIKLSDTSYGLQREGLIENVLRKPVSHINSVDLGDLRGTHWDIAFEQVYRPKDDGGFYRHQFPRRAVQSSVIELLAVFKTLGGFEATGGAQ